MTGAPEQSAVDAARKVVAALGEGVRAAYLVGSGSYGGFEPGESDLDVIVVWAAPLTRAEREGLAERARAVDVAPARGLELVVYADGERVLNLNTGPGITEHVAYAADEDPPFWFVLDRAIAQEHAVTLVGDPWPSVFEPVPRREMAAALEESLDWHERFAPRTANAVLNAVRAWRWAEAGRWVSKPEALAWIVARARTALREAA